MRSNANGGKNYESDFHGLLGEIAYAKHFNLYPDLSIGKRINTYDFMHDGKRIDIKTNHKIDGGLIVNERDNIDVDVYVLALLDESPNVVHLAGYIEKDVLRQENNLREFKFNEGIKRKYIMHQQNLKRF